VTQLSGRMHGSKSEHVACFCNILGVYAYLELLRYFGLGDRLLFDAMVKEGGIY
jgi:hypothetical protein